jgi:hypothetical protein
MTGRSSKSYKQDGGKTRRFFWVILRSIANT